MNARIAIAYLAGLASGVMIALAVGSAAQTGAAPSVPDRRLQLIDRVMKKIQSDYVERVEADRLVSTCLNGMLAGLDSRSNYFGPETREKTSLSSGPELVGVGAELEMRGAGPSIVSVLTEAPAHRAGLHSGDVIVKVGSESTRGKSLGEVVALIRGKAGSEVRLTVARPLHSEYSLKREPYLMQTVKSSVPEPGVAHLRVSRFDEFSAGHIALELTKLAKQPGGLKGIVLDLRDNPGGPLESAVAAAALFLPPDAVIVNLEGRTPESKSTLRANPRDYQGSSGQDFRANLPQQVREVPLAVLINHGTAAGAEIVAGAMQDHKRAAIVGEQSHGLGLARTVFPVGDQRWVDFATQRLSTPNGRTVDGRGIAPDFAVGDARGASPNPDPALARAISALKR